jgi:hypothetical protein
VKTDNPATGITGFRVGGEPENEAEHFMECPVCGQAFDMRDLGQVFHHDQPQHERLRTDA